MARRRGNLALHCNKAVNETTLYPLGDAHDGRPTSASLTNADPTGPGVIILAAGRSSRMGSTKQLLEWHGQPLIRHAVQTALASVCSPVVVVVGFAAGLMRDALSGLPVHVAENSAWERGMGTSIRTGVQALSAYPVHSLILTLADLPLLTPKTFDYLLQVHRETGKPIITAEYSGTVGVPVLFHRDLFGELLSLEDSQGCKGVILRHRDRSAGVACPAAGFDLDTPEEYQRIRAQSSFGSDGIS